MKTVGAIEALARINQQVHNDEVEPFTIWVMTPGGLIIGELASRMLLPNMWDGHEDGPAALRIGDLGCYSDEPLTFLLFEKPYILTGGVMVRSEWTVIPLSSVQAWGEDLSTPFGDFGVVYGRERSSRDGAH